MSTDTGGPAFPFVMDKEDFDTGMTLRDYFAAKAPLDSLKFASEEAAAKFAGMSVPTTDEELVVVGFACSARAAYIYADAMLKARQS